VGSAANSVSVNIVVTVLTAG